MKQTARIISTYSADIFGVCSALFELGGMVVMHDPSGCNSTYTTHDEPRWFDTESQIYISGLTEMDAILGNDRRLIDDITETALLQQPAFICIVGSQIPAMIGCDLPAVARIVEKNTGIRTFSLPTNSMHSYVHGVYLALEALAGMMADSAAREPVSPRHINVLGLTPLDFSVNGSAESICRWLAGNDFTVVSRWAMGSSLENLRRASRAEVNLVVSYGGLGAARAMEKAWGTPYVIGVPFGSMKKRLLPCLEPPFDHAYPAARPFSSTAESVPEKNIYLIGESVFSSALATALEDELHCHIRVICPVETEDRLLRPGDLRATDEIDLEPLFSNASAILADPLYEPICPAGTPFIELPQEGFSGRLYRKYIPDLIASSCIRDGIPELQKIPG